ncbi:phage holin [Peribacillus sp. SCS-155]|uniref:phage holin n=1 Tax=Peribacillus sedimenti TaxID=3115297 RepID=UPI0039057CF2
MINWKVRFKNRVWIMSFISQFLIIIQMLVTGLNHLGVIDFQWSEYINIWVQSFVNAVLVLLSMLGMVQDPTTKGLADSEQALNYEEPR